MIGLKSKKSTKLYNKTKNPKAEKSSYSALKRSIGNIMFLPGAEETACIFWQISTAKNKGINANGSIIPSPIVGKMKTRKPIATETLKTTDKYFRILDLIVTMDLS